MGLHKSTKYLAKTYFDMIVTQLPKINATNASLYLLTSIFLAVKVKPDLFSLMKVELFLRL